MRKYLVAALAVVMAASMSMTALAAGSPSSSSSSNNTTTQSSSSSKKSSRSKSHGSSGGGSSAASSSSSSKSGSSSASSAQAAANAAVTAVYKPAQVVLTAGGQAVNAAVSVAAQPDEMKAAFAAVAPIFGVTVTDNFTYAAAGVDPTATVTTVFAAGSVPAGSMLLVVDALGNLTIVMPTVLPDGTIAAVLPAMCQVAVVSVPVVPAA